MDQIKGCKMTMREDSETFWKLVIDELTSDGKELLMKLSKRLGPHSKKYLAKRIEATTPEGKKFLKEIGF